MRYTTPQLENVGAALELVLGAITNLGPDRVNEFNGPSTSDGTLSNDGD